MWRYGRNTTVISMGDMSANHTKVLRPASTVYLLKWINNVLLEIQWSLWHVFLERSRITVMPLIRPYIIVVTPQMYEEMSHFYVSEYTQAMIWHQLLMKISVTSKVGFTEMWKNAPAGNWTLREAWKLTVPLWDWHENHSKESQRIKLYAVHA